MLRASFHPGHWVIETGKEINEPQEHFKLGNDAWQESHYRFAPVESVNVESLDLPVKSSIDYIASRVEQQLFAAAPKFIGIHENQNAGRCHWRRLSIFD